MNVPFGPSTPETPRSRLGRACAWLAALVLLIPASADAAKLRGKVDGFRNLLNPVWAEARDPKQHGYSFREPVATVRAEFRRLFPHVPKEICVAAIAIGPQKAPPPVLVRVGGGRTTPVTIVVPPNTRLTFQNTDPFKHRLYGVNINSFQPADTLRGANREWSVPGPGVFRDPRCARAEPQDVGDRRAKRGGDRVPLHERRLRVVGRAAGRVHGASLLRWKKGRTCAPGHREGR
jgi:hypothetical protein